MRAIGVVINHANNTYERPTCAVCNGTGTRMVISDIEAISRADVLAIIDAERATYERPHGKREHIDTKIRAAEQIAVCNRILAAISDTKEAET